MKKIKVNESQDIRINKYLSEAGFCSRRQADKYLEQGLVYINGNRAKLGDRVIPSDEVVCDGKKVIKENELILLAFNKPRGIVCTTSRKDKNNIVDYINYGKRIYPVGRLDQDSEGLILLTNDGELTNKILMARYHHEKEYEVVVNKKIDNDFLRNMSKGVYLKELETTTRECKVERISDVKFRIVLTQGLNRQIRRMCEEFDYRVKELKRVRIMNINLGNIRLGEYRELTKQETKTLISMLR